MKHAETTGVAEHVASEAGAHIVTVDVDAGRLEIKANYTITPRGAYCGDADVRIDGKQVCPPLCDKVVLTLTPYDFPRLELHEVITTK